MKLLYAFVFITLISSASFALNGTVKNNQYFSPNHKFSVEIPKIMSLNIREFTQLNGHMQNVTFVTGKGFWMIDGNYQVDFFDAPRAKRKKARVSDAMLMKVISKNMKQAIQGGEVGRVSKLSSPKCQFVKALGVKAYQCVYSFDAAKKGLFVGTSVFLNAGWFHVYGIESIEHGFNWSRYNRMLNSIRVYE